MTIGQNYQKIKSILGLSFSLAKVKFKLRNEGSYLGMFWYLLYPLAMFSILLFLRNLINAGIIEYYPVYLLLGLIMFNLFSQATNNSTSAILSNSGLIKSLKINYEPFIISGILQSVFSHFFEIIILTAFLLYFKISLIGLIFYPLILLFLIIFIIGLSFILATLGAYVSDLANAWSVLVVIIWFAVPIYYIVPKDNVPFINKINPMFYFIDNARQFVIYNTMPSVKMLVIMFLCSFVFFIVGIFVFKKYKNKFPEIV